MHKLRICRSGECYEILVGEAGNQGIYNLSITCDVLTDATIKPLSCGNVSVGSTRNLPILRDLDRSAGGQLHQFCPARNATAQIATCNSKYDTKLYVYGPGVALNCNGNCCNGNCGFKECGSGGWNEEVTFDFEAGECYEIIVGGYFFQEGDYVLSLGCFNFTAEVECGSNVSGSTVGLNGGVQRHRFCSKEITRVEASTCGSNFPTDLQLNDSSIMLGPSCTDCPNDPNAACISFNTRFREVVVQVVGGFRKVPVVVPEGFGRLWCRFRLVPEGSGRLWCKFRAGSGRFREVVASVRGGSGKVPEGSGSFREVPGGCGGSGLVSGRLVLPRVFHQLSKEIALLPGLKSF
eukprot:s2147_g17.t1